MAIQLQGGSSGIFLNINKRGQASVVSESLNLEHFVSRFDGGSYELNSRLPVSGNTSVLHIKNESDEKSVIISNMRLMAASLGGYSGTFPSSNTYFEVSVGSTRNSGGSTITPINKNRTSGKIGSVLCYTGANTNAGTSGIVLDRGYYNNEEIYYDKRESIILGLNDTLEIRLVTDATSGEVYSKICLIELDFNGE